MSSPDMFIACLFCVYPFVTEKSTFGSDSIKGGAAVPVFVLFSRGDCMALFRLDGFEWAKVVSSYDCLSGCVVVCLMHFLEMVWTHRHHREVRLQFQVARGFAFMPTCFACTKV